MKPGAAILLRQENNGSRLTGKGSKKCMVEQGQVQVKSLRFFQQLRPAIHP